MKGLQAMIEISSDPDWIKEMVDFLKPYGDKVVHSRIFEDIKRSSVSLEQMQIALTFFYPLVESFPSFMAVALSRVPLGDSRTNKTTREWLIANMTIERLHTRWWKDWAV